MVVMSKKPASELSKIIKDESQAFWDAVNGEDDLSCVLVSVSYIEQCLESILRSVLVDHKLSSKLVGRMQLQQKLDTLFCLGQIPEKIQNDIEQMAIVRNHFAHSHFQASFTDQKVTSAIGKLEVKSGLPGPLSSRDRFVSSAVTCSQIIQVHGLSAKKAVVLNRGGL
jgi:DNA-binding MltR family transcriptional regulator